jgi:hypothetical protein
MKVAHWHAPGIGHISLPPLMKQQLAHLGPTSIQAYIQDQRDAARHIKGEGVVRRG